MIRNSARRSLDNAMVLKSDDAAWLGLIVDSLVEALLKRGTAADIREAQAESTSWLPLLEIRRLSFQGSVAPPARVVARAHGNYTKYRDSRNRYRAMATPLGFEGHTKWAEEMP